MNKAEPDIQVILVGNKIDKVRQNPGTREVEIEEAQNVAERNGFMFVETSAFASTNVTTAFETLLNAISETRQRQGGSYGMDKSKACLKLHDPDLED